MKPSKIDENCFLVEWKYKEFLRIGYEFQGKTIIKLEKFEHLRGEYVKVTTEPHHNKI
jgi:hypothetical protein